MKIVFLLYNAYGIGGTIRSTVNLSAALAARHDVQVVSVHQAVDAPQLPIDPRVTLTSLIDWRPGAGDPAAGDPAATQPSEMFTDDGVCNGPFPPSRLTDLRVAAFLRGTDADVVVATRPVLNGYLARHGSARQVRIGQEHVLLQMHREALRAGQNAAIAALDAFVTVSEADAADYRAALPGVGTRILCVPNCSPPALVTPSTGDSLTVVAAGRLIPVKRYDRLVDAFAIVAEQRPDWQLRLYGRGVQRAALRQRIDDLGLYHHVRLMGAVAPIETEWAKGAIAAVSSDRESFGMTIVEAMQCGVPVVATDCPYGPGEIITHGENGLLSPSAGGAEAFADALVGLIDDEDGRRAMARAARRRAADFAPEIIARRYERLIEELAAAKRGRLRRLLGGGPARPDRRSSPAGTETPGDRAAHAVGAAAPPVETPGPPSANDSPRPASGTDGPVRRGLGRRGAGEPGDAGDAGDGRRWPARRGRPGADDVGNPADAPGPARRPLGRRGRPEAGAGTDGAAAPDGSAEVPDARCAVLTDGSLRVSVGPGAPAELLLRLRRDPERREVRVPFAPADGRRVAVLDRAAHVLAEGRWDCYVTACGRTKGRRRLGAALVEQAALLTLPPVVDARGVSAWIPYPTSDGFLAVRSWLRPAHAEVERVHVAEPQVTVTAELLGRAAPAAWDAARVAAVPRDGGATAFEVRVEPLGGGRFRCVLPHAEALARYAGPGQDVWDLALVCAPDADPVPMGRITGDGVTRKRTDVFPAAAVDGPGGEQLLVRPYFTVHQMLAVSVAPVAPAAPAGPSVPVPACGDPAAVTASGVRRQ